jgi:hypothetical protein
VAENLLQVGLSARDELSEVKMFRLHLFLGRFF